MLYGGSSPGDPSWTVRQQFSTQLTHQKKRVRRGPITLCRCLSLSLTASYMLYNKACVQQHCMFCNVCVAVLYCEIHVVQTWVAANTSVLSVGRRLGGKSTAVFMRGRKGVAHSGRVWQKLVGFQLGILYYALVKGFSQFFTGLNGEGVLRVIVFRGQFNARGNFVISRSIIPP